MCCERGQPVRSIPATSVEKWAWVVVITSLLLHLASQGGLPIPTPTPPTPKPPAPIPIAGLHGLIVYESKDQSKLPPEQLAALTADAPRAIFRAKQGELRVFDQDVQQIENEAKWVQDAFKRPRSATPWVIISNGKTGFEGPMPKSTKELVELVQKYAE